PAAIVVPQLLAHGVHQQVPVLLLLEKGRPVMEHNPADVPHVLERGGGLVGDGDVVTALGRAMFAKVSAGREILALDLDGSEPGSGAHGGQSFYYGASAGGSRAGHNAELPSIVEGGESGYPAGMAWP